MLREVERPDGSKVAFEYDAFARRTKKRLLSAAGEVLRETRYVWDGHVIVHELGSEDDELITWRFEPETFTPIAKERGERRWAIASDHLGTPTEMVDELGKLAWKMQLDVLGVPAFEEGDAAHCPFRWPGQYEDEETGLYYNRFRYYDPEQGGYTADDPIGLEGGIRLRGYVEDPWTWVDPWGLIALDAQGFALYHIVERSTGKVTYVGITNNVHRRQLAHKNSGRLDDSFRMLNIHNDLSYAEARGFEQADIAHYNTRQTKRIGLAIQAGEANRQWSYDPSRTDSRADAFRVHENRRRQQHRGGCK